MPDVWASHWAFAAETTGTPLVVGEIGGFYTGKDAVWMDWAIDYCKTNNIGLF